MKNSSAPTAPTLVAADISSAMQPTDDSSIVHGGAARAHEDEDTGFTTVTRSKSGRNSSTQKEAVPCVTLPPPKSCTFKDPFGLTRVNPRTMNPATISMARTKQSARSSTLGPSHLFCKGAHQDAMRARIAAAQARREALPKKPKSTLPRNLYVDPEPSDDSDDGWETASESSPPPPTVGSAAPKANPVVDVPGRFNGRVHKTTGDGACGVLALLAAMRHLVSAKGYNLVVPETAQELREALVDDIAENLDLAGVQFTATLREQLTDEYLRPTSKTGHRQMLHNPDLSAVSGVPGVVVNSIQEYIDIMSMEHTHLDEFMLAAFSRLWDVRVAVLQRVSTTKGSRITTENAQFVPRRTLEAELTLFLVRSGEHFDWAHANSAPCDDPACNTKTTRISAQHVPTHVTVEPNSNSGVDTGISSEGCVVPESDRESPEPPTPASTIADANAPRNTASNEFEFLMTQLMEEYPGLSPDRADAALKITKQNGKFSVYRAARILRGSGVEGAPIMLDSPTRGNEPHDPQAFTADKRAREGEGEQAQTTKQPMYAPCCGAHAQTSGCRRDAAESATCDHGQGKCCDKGRATSPAVISPDPDVASANASMLEQAIQYASQIISLTAKVDLYAAREALGRHMPCGNLTVAAQRACAELMDGPPKRTKFRSEQDGVEPPDDEMGSLAERHFGVTARTPTVRAMAKGSGNKQALAAAAAEDRPSTLFEQRLQANLQHLGGSLTAGQRLATAARRTEQQLFEEARDARFLVRRLNDELGDLVPGRGGTPASAVLVDNTQDMRDPSRTLSPCQQQPAFFHSSPVVRVAQRMQARQGQVNSPHGTVIVVNSAGGKLPTWKAGKEADGKGFNWRTKQRMVNAWEQYQISEGLHAPKSFKSMVDIDLIPVICAECQLDETTWETLDDVTLLMAIEEKLKPHDSMGFTVQLKQIVFSNDEAQGTLTQRYRAFSEAFLATVSEAKAAGCAVPDNVVRLTFTRALASNPILSGWLEQEKWASAGETHRRITNCLKRVDAYEMLTAGKLQQHPQPAQQVAQPAHVQQPLAPVQSATQQLAPQASAPANGQGGGGRQQARFNNQLQAAVNQALAAYQLAHIQQTPATALPVGHVNAFPAQHARSPLPPLNLPMFPGLDDKGLNWHVHSALLGCRSFPCQAPFCQACGMHGHHANECRRRFYNNPEANTSGYWSIQRPNTPSLRRQPAVNVAVQAPPFPVPYVMKSKANMVGGSNATNQQSNVGGQQAPSAAANYAAQQPAQGASSNGGQQ